MTGERFLDLGIIANGQVGALIDRDGRYVWFCHGRYDGDPAFLSLIDGTEPPERGFMDVELDNRAGSEQRYRRNTAILVTELADSAGPRLRLVDFAPRFKQFDRVFRPRMVMRRIEPVSGACRIRIRIRPVFGWGEVRPTLTMGSNHLRYVADGSALRVTTDAPISYIAEEHWFILDRPLTLILGSDEPFVAGIAATASEFERDTELYWQEWVRYLSLPFEWQAAVIRAAITLKLCSYEETGAIVAAMTSSISESAKSIRNWDYRYCWLRDAYFVVHALNRLGATRTMEEFIGYVTNVATLDPDGPLDPVYGIIPGSDMTERTIAGLRGYRGQPPVRVGNLAQNQRQNDSYGSVVLAATQLFVDERLPEKGDEELFRRLESLGERAFASAFEPDAGLWEFRARTAIHTYSSAMCWAACDRLATIAGLLNLADRQEFWSARAATLRDTVLARGFNAELGSFVASFEGDDIDASLLLLAEIGFVESDDPRFLGTLDLIERRLMRDGYLIRYADPDDFGVPSVSFIVCNFWLVDAFVAVGRRDEARALFERVLDGRNHLGLLSEDFDPVTGELWGNFPQTYSMVGLIVSAMRLSKDWE
jgi:hypothetical protein